MVGRWGSWGTVWGPGQSLLSLVPNGRGDLVTCTEPEQEKKPLKSSAPFTSLEKRCRDFQHIHILPDVSGLIKPPPLGSGQQASKGIEADRLGMRMALSQ